MTDYMQVFLRIHWYANTDSYVVIDSLTQPFAHKSKLVSSQKYLLKTTIFQFLTASSFDRAVQGLKCL